MPIIERCKFQSEHQTKHTELNNTRMSCSSIFQQREMGATSVFLLLATYVAGISAEVFFEVTKRSAIKIVIFLLS